MIPYFTFSVIPLGPLNIQVWGLMVALGIGLAMVISYRRARQWGLDPSAFLDMAAWALLAAVLGSRLMYVFAYEPSLIVNDPAAAFRIWEGGLSMIGGLLGAGLAVVLFCRRHKLSFMDYADLTAFGLPWGYAVGRLGCFFIHDHVGVFSNSLLAVDFPGAPKLDMGLIHALLGLAIGISFLLADRRAKGRRLPYFLMFALIYGLARLFLDFFRYWDAPFAEHRYLKLTPAQWLALPTIALSCWYLANPIKPNWRQRLAGLFGRMRHRN